MPLSSFRGDYFGWQKAGGFFVLQQVRGECFLRLRPHGDDATETVVLGHVPFGTISPHFPSTVDHFTYKLAHLTQPSPVRNSKPHYIGDGWRLIWAWGPPTVYHSGRIR
jgi:hypothetical protein